MSMNLCLSALHSTKVPRNIGVYKRIPSIKGKSVESANAIVGIGLSLLERHTPFARMIISANDNRKFENVTGEDRTP